MQSAACATGGAMGRYLTEVRRATWLKEHVPFRGQPGLFEASVPRACLPAEVLAALMEPGAQQPSNEQMASGDW